MLLDGETVRKRIRARKPGRSQVFATLFTQGLCTIYSQHVSVKTSQPTTQRKSSRSSLSSINDVTVVSRSPFLEVVHWAGLNSAARATLLIISRRQENA